MTRLLPVAPVAVALLATAALARAEPVPPARPAAPVTSSLSWVRLPGAEACIGSRALAVAVERRLQHEVFVPASRAAIAVEGRVEPVTTGGKGFRAVILVSDEAGVPQGSREILGASSDCAAMNDDLALVIAVMIDPEAALAPRLPAAKAPRPPPPAPPPPVPPPPPCVDPPSWHVSLEAGGEAMVGLLPGVSGGVLLRTHIEPPRFWAFELGGVLFPAVSAAQGTVSASFQLAEAIALVCPLTLRAFGGTLSACAGVEVGSIRGDSPAVALGFEEGVFNVALAGRARRRLVGPLMAGAGLGLSVPILRERFLTSPGGDLFSMAPVAGTVDLSLGIEFP